MWEVIPEERGRIKGHPRGIRGRKGLKFMSFYPGIGGGISNVQCGMFLTHGGGFGSPIRVFLAKRNRI